MVNNFNLNLLPFCSKSKFTSAKLSIYRVKRNHFMSFEDLAKDYAIGNFCMSGACKCNLQGSPSLPNRRCNEYPINNAFDSCDASPNENWTTNKNCLICETPEVKIEGLILVSPPSFNENPNEFNDNQRKGAMCTFFQEVEAPLVDASTQTDILEKREQRKNAHKRVAIYNKENIIPKCKCTRIGCDKNYCDCHKSGIACGKFCTCLRCKNVKPSNKKISKQLVKRAYVNGLLTYKQ